MGSGGSIEVTETGEDTSVRPGSWNAAKVQEGLPEDLRDPIRVHASRAGNEGRPAQPRPWPGGTSDLPGALRRARSEGGSCGLRKRTNKRPQIRGWEVVAPS